MIEKEDIISKAEDLILRYGVKSVTMDDICRKIGISKKTLYQLVDDKKSLIREIISMHIKEEKESIEEIRKDAANAIDELLQIAEFVVSVLKKMTPFVIYDLQKYHHESWLMLEDFHQTFIMEVIKTNLINGIKEGYYRSSMNTDIIAKFYIGKSMLLADEKIFPSKEYNREALFREFIMYHLNGVLSEKGARYLSSKNQIIS